MTGNCENCMLEFQLKLIHNGFNNTQYCYCDRCGKTAFLSTHAKHWPAEVIRDPGEIAVQMERHLAPCDCGGRFTKGSSPRCPSCNRELSAERATEYIERQAPGTKTGWRWQRSWNGMYCIVVVGRQVSDNYVEKS
jgi:hypothetical protein